ncbi:hypothetical protein RIF29_14877 [Crotalaria pallida]|uniref:Uncharacterized protein n=1 Tax=Crotalaria pallida TaxID=3830 RepID=A0AAN9FE77_CROPI
MQTERNPTNDIEKALDEINGATLNTSAPVHEKEGHVWVEKKKQSTQEGTQKQKNGPEEIVSDHQKQNDIEATKKVNDAADKPQDFEVGGSSSEVEILPKAIESNEVDKEVEMVPDSQEGTWTPAKTRNKTKQQAQRGLEEAQVLSILTCLELEELNSKKFHSIDKQDEVLRGKLLAAQESLANDPLNVQLQKIEKEANQDYARVIDAATSFLKQKAKELWLKDGDQNTRPFHQAIKIRAYKNIILSIQDASGAIPSDQKQISDVFLNFYKDLLNGPSTIWCMSEEEVMQGSTLTLEQQIRLVRPVIEDEITASLMSIHIDKV